MKRVKALLALIFVVPLYANSSERDWMPDPALRAAVREVIELPPAAVLTKDHMLWFDYLHAWHTNITDLTGLEHATRLRDLNICDNGGVSDLTPLANLTNLEYLGLCGSQISDVSPLANLTNLKGLDLGWNNISDITPLENLVNLEWINLGGNPIENIEILANFTKLTNVRLTRTYVTDFTPLSDLNLTEFMRDEVCEVSPLGMPIASRIESRTYPSIALPGSSLVTDNPLRYFAPENPVDYYNLATKHDISYFPNLFSLHGGERHYGLQTKFSGNVERAMQEQQEYLRRNPNFIVIPQVHLHIQPSLKAFPADSDFWLRGSTGEVMTNPEAPWEYLMDILNPELQELLIDRIVGLAECGLYDGVLIDGLFEHGVRYSSGGHAGREEEVIAAHAYIFRSVRERVRDDFLIVANTSRTKLIHYAEWVNGGFMEMAKDYQGGYTYKGLKEIESTVLWNETNFREPRINILQGHGVAEPFESFTNLCWMRLFTTMSLTHSDGYSIFRVPREMNGRFRSVHIWYDFWDADLGVPIGEKAQLYENRDGLFIREFTNGWAVYNRSGVAQTINFPVQATGVASGQSNTVHIVPDLDGEMYLKSTVDLNGDGVVNILDLVIIANAFGQTDPDLNGDGVVNILDLVIIANNISQTSK